MRYIFLALLVMLTSCSLVPQREVYLSEPLPLPERPLLPTVAASDWVDTDNMVCLPVYKYTNLVDRDAILRGYAEHLEAIIKSTWPEE